MIMILKISSDNCNPRSLIPEDSEARPRTQKSQSERRKVKVDQNCSDLKITKLVVVKSSNQDYSDIEENSKKM